MNRATTVLAAGLLASVTAGAQQPPASAVPPQTVDRIAPDVLALACAPRAVERGAAPPMRISAAHDSASHRAFAPGDIVTIEVPAGTSLSAGQEFFTRRVLRDPGYDRRKTPAVVHTSGWVRVYAVDGGLALATITHACDSVELGDYLEPFALPAVPPPSAAAAPPQRDNYGQVQVGADRRRTFGRGDMIVVNRGSNQGVEPGSRFTVFRDTQQKDAYLFQLAEAVAVDVRQDSSTLRVTAARDALQAGDYVALRK